VRRIVIERDIGERAIAAVGPLERAGIEDQIVVPAAM